MKKMYVLLAVFVCGLTVGLQAKAEEATKAVAGEWKDLLDKTLSQWRIYQSYELKNGYNGGKIVDADGNAVQPIGYDRNVKDVFTVVDEDGEPVLHITGEVYGCVFTRQDFRNYHFRMKMRWGSKKWEPRLNDALDSGLLYHSQGECGVDYWQSWMLAHEFQVCEETNGEYWTIAHSQIEVRAKKEGDTWIFDPEAEKVRLGAGSGNSGHCLMSANAEKPMGEWNELELICYKGKSLHIVNGEVVMAISGLYYWDGNKAQSLDEGKLQLQSEAGEVFYKDIWIKEIDGIPEQYRHYFAE
ncbi:hypothetical protein Barb7_00966 [Bacteroidales bacterium Barb7]|nr:hypothetical protein Barb7_00966 [Bacteroidales bacterium Barb7]